MKLSDNELICEYVKSQIRWTIKETNTHYSTTTIRKHCEKLERELVKRGILTAEDIKDINS